MKWVLDQSMPADSGVTRATSYASDLFILFACPRRYYWDRVDPIKDDRSWFVTAETGNHMHLMIVDFFKRAGLWRGDEVRGGNAACNISYRMDLTIADPSAGGMVVPVEIKSANANSYHGKEYRGHPEWTKIGYKVQPGYAHYLQLQAYLHFHKPFPYPHGYLCYLSKNDGEFSLFKVQYDPATGNEIERALINHEFCVINELMPAASHDPADDHGECRWCPYRERCAGLIEAAKAEGACEEVSE